MPLLPQRDAIRLNRSVIRMGVLFGALVQALKTLEGVFERASECNVQPDQRTFDPMSHGGGGSQVSTIDLLDQCQELIGQRLDLTLRERTVHDSTIGQIVPLFTETPAFLRSESSQMSWLRLPRRELCTSPLGVRGDLTTVGSRVKLNCHVGRSSVQFSRRGLSMQTIPASERRPVRLELTMTRFR